MVAKRKWNPAHHPRDSRGRFTRSSTRVLKGSDSKRATAAVAGFKPKEITDTAGASAYLQAAAGKTDDDAVKAYFAGGWQKTNPTLRAGKTDESVAALDAAMQPLPDDIMLTRQVPLKMFAHVPMAELEGMKVRDAAYASTSPQIGSAPSTGADMVTLHIAAPAGTNAIVNPADNEILLARDTEVAISAVRPNGQGGYDVYGVIIPTSSASRPAKNTDTPADNTPDTPDVPATPDKPASSGDAPEPADTTPDAPTPAKKAAPAKKSAPAKAAPTSTAGDRTPDAGSDSNGMTVVKDGNGWAVASPRQEGFLSRHSSKAAAQKFIDDAAAGRREVADRARALDDATAAAAERYELEPTTATQLQPGDVYVMQPGGWTATVDQDVNQFDDGNPLALVHHQLGPDAPAGADPVRLMAKDTPVYRLRDPQQADAYRAAAAAAQGAADAPTGAGPTVQQRVDALKPGDRFATFADGSDMRTVTRVDREPGGTTLIHHDGDGDPVRYPADGMTNVPAEQTPAPVAPEDRAGSLTRNEYAAVTGVDMATGAQVTRTGFVSGVHDTGDGSTVVSMTRLPDGAGSRDMVRVAPGAPVERVDVPDNIDRDVVMWKDAKTGRPVLNPSVQNRTAGRVVRDPEREAKAREAIARLRGETATPDAPDAPAGEDRLDPAVANPVRQKWEEHGSPTRVIWFGDGTRKAPMKRGEVATITVKGTGRNRTLMIEGEGEGSDLLRRQNVTDRLWLAPVDAPAEGDTTAAAPDAPEGAPTSTAGASTPEAPPAPLEPTPSVGLDTRPPANPDELLANPTITASPYGNGTEVHSWAPELSAPRVVSVEQVEGRDVAIVQYAQVNFVNDKPEMYYTRQYFAVPADTQFRQMRARYRDGKLFDTAGSTAEPVGPFRNMHLASGATPASALSGARRQVAKDNALQRYAPLVQSSIGEHTRADFDALDPNAPIRPGDLVALTSFQKIRTGVAYNVTGNKVEAFVATPSNPGNIVTARAQKGVGVRRLGGGRVQFAPAGQQPASTEDQDTAAGRDFARGYGISGVAEGDTRFRMRNATTGQRVIDVHGDDGTRLATISEGQGRVRTGWRVTDTRGNTTSADTFPEAVLVAQQGPGAMMAARAAERRPAFTTGDRIEWSDGYGTYTGRVEYAGSTRAGGDTKHEYRLRVETATPRPGYTGSAMDEPGAIVEVLQTPRMRKIDDSVDDPSPTAGTIAPDAASVTAQADPFALVGAPADDGLDAAFGPAPAGPQINVDDQVRVAGQWATVTAMVGDNQLRVRFPGDRFAVVARADVREHRPAARELDMLGGSTAFVPQDRSTIGVAGPATVGRTPGMQRAQQESMFAIDDVSAPGTEAATLLDSLLQMPAAEPPASVPVLEPDAPDTPTVDVPDDITSWTDEQLSALFQEATAVEDEVAAGRVLDEWERRETEMQAVLARVPEDLTTLDDDAAAMLLAEVTSHPGTVDTDVVDRLVADLDRRDAERIAADADADRKRGVLAGDVRALDDDALAEALGYAAELGDDDAHDRILGEFERRDAATQAAEAARVEAERQAAVAAALEESRRRSAEIAAAQRDSFERQMQVARGAGALSRVSSNYLAQARAVLGDERMRELIGGDVDLDDAALFVDMTEQDKQRLMFAAAGVAAEQEFGDYNTAQLWVTINAGAFGRGTPEQQARSRMAAREQSRRALVKAREEQNRELDNFRRDILSVDVTQLSDEHLAAAPALIGAMYGPDGEEAFTYRLPQITAEARRRGEQAASREARLAAGPAGPARVRNPVKELGHIELYTSDGYRHGGMVGQDAGDRMRRAKRAVFGLPEDTTDSEIRKAASKDPRGVAEQAALILAWYRHYADIELEGKAVDSISDSWLRGPVDDPDVPDVVPALPAANITNADKVWEALKQQAIEDRNNGDHSGADRFAKALARAYGVPYDDTLSGQPLLEAVLPETSDALRRDDRTPKQRAASFVTEWRRLAKEDGVDPSDTARYGPAEKPPKTGRGTWRESTPAQQAQIDALVARGYDWIEAYAEVHQLDPDVLRREEASSAAAANEGGTAAARRAVEQQYAEWVDLRVLEAEKATAGNLLNKAGVAAGKSPKDLFSGPITTARKYASEELLRWWTENPRLTFAAFKAQLTTTGSKQARERSAAASNGKDFV